MKDINTILADLKKSPKQMMAVISAATAILVLAYSFFVLKPQLIGIFANIGKLTKVTADLYAGNKDIAKINSMKDSVADYNNKIGQYERSLPTEEGIPGLLENLSDMANKSDMRIVGIVPLDNKNSKAASRAYMEIPIIITAKSGYHELGNFLSALENSDRLMKITDIQIKSDSASPRKHNVELTVITYVLLGAK